MTPHPWGPHWGLQAKQPSGCLCLVGVSQGGCGTMGAAVWRAIRGLRNRGGECGREGVREPGHVPLAEWTRVTRIGVVDVALEAKITKKGPHSTYPGGPEKVGSSS